MRIIPEKYKWAHGLVHRNGKPKLIVWHHSVGTGSAQAVHRIHVGIGDSGIGYHYYVRKDGRIYRGRPEWAMGAHCYMHNDELGVCAEGSYHITKVMPAKQLAALQWLHDDISRRYKGIGDCRHKDMPDNRTACPGVFFPYSKVVAGVDKSIKVTIKESWLDRFKVWKSKQSKYKGK